MRRVALTAVAVLTVLATGCGGDSEAKPTHLDVGYAYGADVGDVGDVLAFRALEQEHGISSTPRDLGGASEAVVGLTRGDVQIAQVPYRQFVDAISAGAPVKAVLGQNMAPEIVLVGGPGISSVADLEGRRIGTTSPGGGGDVLITESLAQAGLTRDQVDVVYVDESTTRAAALAAGRLDASTLDYADFVLLRRRAPREYTILDRAVDRFPRVPQLVWAVDTGWAEDNEGLLEQAVAGLVRGYETAYGPEGRAAWLAEARKEFLTGRDAAVAPAIYRFYRDLELWPKATTVVTKAAHDRAVAAWAAAGEIEEAVPYDDAWLPDYWLDVAGG